MRPRSCPPTPRGGACQGAAGWLEWPGGGTDPGVIADPQAGRQPPPPATAGGHGLWLVHQVCDQVELHSDGNGTVILMHMSLR